jgi:hypothetical protein
MLYGLKGKRVGLHMHCSKLLVYGCGKDEVGEPRELNYGNAAGAGKTMEARKNQRQFEITKNEADGVPHPMFHGNLRDRAYPAVWMFQENMAATRART